MSEESRSSPPTPAEAATPDHLAIHRAQQADDEVWATWGWLADDPKEWEPICCPRLSLDQVLQRETARHLRRSEMS